MLPDKMWKLCANWLKLGFDSTVIELGSLRHMEVHREISSRVENSSWEIIESSFKTCALFLQEYAVKTG